MAGNESRRIAGETYPAWLKPFDAIATLLKAGLDDREHAVNWLAARLKTCELRAIALDFEITADLEVGEEYYYYVAPRVWRKISDVHWKDDFWISGTFRDDEDHMFQDRILPQGLTIIEARFEPDIIHDFLQRSLAAPQNNSPTAPPLPTKGSGGRPPKPFWDQLWPSIAADLFTGSLKPQRQGDIEKAMHDWLTTNGHDAGETTVRRAARSLWQAISNEGQN